MKKTLFLLVVFYANIAFSQSNSDHKIFQLQHPDYALSPYTGMTRNNWKDAALYLLDGAFSYVHSLDDPMKFPKQEGKSYPRNDGQIPTEKLEGLCRTLFVAAPLLREDSNLTVRGIRVAEYYRYQIKKLVDLNSNTFIKPRAKNGGPSQNLVEFGALSISLTAIPDILWNPLPKSTRDSLAATMSSYGDGPTVPSNWKFFNIFVMSFLKTQGYKVNEKLMVEYLQKSLDHYKGDGWYNDNPAYDYYSMWAFQMYGIYWAHYYGKQLYPEFAQKFTANFREMENNYPYLFSKDGKLIMWGRSISYRFGAVASFTLAGLEPENNTNYGWMRRISSATLLQFLQHPNFMKDNVPTLGFYGAFEPAVQTYSCRGSIYWSGKAFLGLLLPENHPFWSTKENNGAWEAEFQKENVYNKFQKGSEILITNYPNSGATEIRAWCNVPVIGAGEPFRGSENYNRLSYSSEFPWQADGKNGEVAMNYVVKNNKKEWEPLRMFTFRKFENETYYRDAVLETDKNIRFNLAEMPLANGILRVDCVTATDSTEIRFGGYALAQFKSPIKISTRKIKGFTATIIDNGVYQLVTIPILGWKKSEVMECENLHPEAEKSKVVNLAANNLKLKNGKTQFVTLHLWKKSGEKWKNEEIIPIKNVKINNKSNSVSVTLTNGEKKVFNF